MYQALYRKYRPKTFLDVVGQAHIVRTLQNEVASGTTAHAYLFTGSRGTGKTTCAKVLAKAVNCPNQKDGNPCGECEICRGIDTGNILDVLEIDAASNNGVDNIRQLREEAFFTPAQVRFRVYIIDEVHMLSTGAFNALLKIMEEPPSYVMFILATTESHKVPATILSRCQRFDFRRISSGDIAGHLEKIAQEEGVLLDADAALLIGKLSDGGMRDAVSLLDLCVSQNTNITAQLVADLAGIAGSEHLGALAQCIYEKNAAAALETIGKLHEQSIDFERLLHDFIGFFRDLMILKTVDRPETLVLAMPEAIAQMKPLAAQFSLPEILAVLSRLQLAQGQIGFSSDRKMVVEMTMVELCELPQAAGENGHLLARIEALEKKIAAGVKHAPSTKTPEKKSAAQTEKTAVQPAPKTEQNRQDSAEQEAAAPAKQPEESDEILPFADWEQVLARLAKSNPPLSAALRGSKGYIKGNFILIEAQGELAFKLIRESDFSKTSLRKAIKEQTGMLYNLGPYRGEAPPPQQAPKKDPLEGLVQKAKDAGFSVDES